MTSVELQFPPEPTDLFGTAAPPPVAPSRKEPVASSREEPVASSREEPVAPSREELLKRLREKTRRRQSHKDKGSSTMSTLAAQLAQYTNVDESLIKNMIRETGVKKMAKNPLKFAKKVVEALPQIKAFEK